MRDIVRALILVIMWLAFAGNVMLALFLFVRALSGLVGRLRTIVRGPARVNRPDGREKVMIEPWTARIIDVGRKARQWVPAHGYARPPQETASVKAQAANIGGGKARAA